MTRTVADTALMLNVMAGYDKLDITSVQHAREDYVGALNQPDFRPAPRHSRRLFRRCRSRRWRRPCEARDETARRVSPKERAKSRCPAVTHLGEVSARSARRTPITNSTSSAQPNKYMLPERRRLQATQETRTAGGGLHPREVGDRARAPASGRCVHGFRSGRPADADAFCRRLLDELITRAHDTEARESARRLQLPAVQCHSASRPSRFRAASARAACRSD